MVEAAPLERVVDLARAVRGENHHRDVLGADGADLGDGHLEVGEELEQERLQLLIGAVDLVDEEDGSAFVSGVDRLQERPLEQELLGEEIVADRLAALAAGRLDGAQIEHLARVVPLVDRRGRVETLVALEADERRLEHVGEDLGDLGLADAGLALQQERLAEFQRQKEGRGQSALGDVALVAQTALQLVDGGKGVAGGGGGGGNQLKQSIRVPSLVNGKRTNSAKYPPMGRGMSLR